MNPHVSSGSFSHYSSNNGSTIKKYILINIYIDQDVTKPGVYFLLYHPALIPKLK